MKIAATYKIFIPTFLILISGCLSATDSSYDTPELVESEQSVDTDTGVEPQLDEGDVEVAGTVDADQKSTDSQNARAQQGGSKKDGTHNENAFAHTGSVEEVEVWDNGVAVDSVVEEVPAVQEGDQLVDDVQKGQTIDTAPVSDKSEVREGGLSDNREPVAEPGVDTSYVATYAGCVAEVTLDGSQSHDPDGDVLEFRWNYRGTIFNGVKPIIPMGIGRHMIHLTVTDPGMLLDTGFVSITVESCGLGEDVGASADTYVGHMFGGPNQNHGAEDELILQGSGIKQNLILTDFDYGDIPYYALTKATVVFTVSRPAVGCGGKKGVETAMHKLNQGWIGGDGIFNTYNGSGAGITYNCFVGDSDVSNNQWDCDQAKWLGATDVYEPSTGESVIIAKGQTGTVSYDVTQDFSEDTGAPYGWLLRNENMNSCNVSFFSSEGAPTSEAAPLLLLEFNTDYF